jgi:hypothetical protein
MANDHKATALEKISRSSGQKDLLNLAKNAARHGEVEIEQAALRKLYSIMPSQQPGTLEYDVWQSIYALEDTLKRERGKTVMLSRTRQKIKKDGEKKTVHDLVNGKVSDGFKMLMDRDMPELTFEAVALKHAENFDQETLDKAKVRLETVAKIISE